MNLFRKPSTANAIAAFNKAIDELDAVVALENATVESLDAEIAAKVNAQAAAKDRASEADKIAKRIRKLVA